MGILIEHCAGAFPLWLAPVQVRVLTLTERQAGLRRARCGDGLRAAGLRAELDDRNEKLGYKIREAQLAKVPYMLVVGDKEAADRHRRAAQPQRRQQPSRVARDVHRRRCTRKSSRRGAA